MPEPLEILGRRAGRGHAVALPDLAAVELAEIVADADLDLDAGERPAQVVDDPAAEGRGMIEGQVGLDRLTGIGILGASCDEFGRLRGPALGGMDADVLVPGETEARSGPGDLEKPDLGTLVAGLRRRAEPHAAGGESAVRPGRHGRQ